MPKYVQPDLNFIGKIKNSRFERSYFCLKLHIWNSVHMPSRQNNFIGIYENNVTQSIKARTKYLRYFTTIIVCLASSF
jgi:hypothetical protein